MTQVLGRGLVGSLRRRVTEEIADLFKQNATLRKARYGVGLRLARALIMDRPIFHLLAVYVSLVLVAIVGQWVLAVFRPTLILKFDEASFVKDVASYFITAQVGILAIVSVAVAVVTLLSSRDDSSSGNADIRLYYDQSFAYEAARSGIALLLVLSFQLFWPIQHVAAWTGFALWNPAFQLPFVAVHTLWLGVNFLLFLRFIIASLDFVQPVALEAMREVYSANASIPDDLAERLTASLYMGAPGIIFGTDDMRAGPDITFGYSALSDDEATVEIELIFEQPARLYDVWFGPLVFVVERWRKRSKAKQGVVKKSMFGGSEWEGELYFPVDFQMGAEGKTQLLLRKGGAELKDWERWIIQRCFRFTKVRTRKRSSPSPAAFLEMLIDKAVGQIDRTAITGFKNALNELIQYHRFILAAQNTTDDTGKAVNLAEYGGLWRRPEQEWIGEYRRLYFAAAERISDETHFIEWLGGLPARLFPRPPASFSQTILKSMINIGILEIVALEAWVTKRTLPTYNPLEGQAAVRLAGTDQAAYDNVLMNFVGSWESFEQIITINFGIKQDRRSAADAQWSKFALSWGSVSTHLEVTAFFFAASVWNEDESGAARFRDMLLRWLNPFRGLLRHDYDFRNRLLFTPDLMGRAWDAVKEPADRLGRFAGGERTTPEAIFGFVIRGLHDDVITIVAALALSWFVDEQQASDIGGRAAVQLVRRELLDEGSDLTASVSQPRTVFRRDFDLITRYALNPRFGETGYGSTLDGLVERLGQVASRRMVPGRVYSGFGFEGVETLRPQLLMILAANFPIQGDDGVGELLSDITVEGAPLADWIALDRVVREFETFVSVLGEGPNADFKKGVLAFGSDIDFERGHAALRELLQKSITDLKNVQGARLRAAPLDPEKMQIARSKISEAMLTESIPLNLMRGYLIERGPASEVLQQNQFGTIDKGPFLAPAMSLISLDDDIASIRTIALDYLVQDIWRDFHRRPKTLFEVDMEAGFGAFWRSVIRKADAGHEPTALLPYGPLTDPIMAAEYGQIAEELRPFEVKHLPDIESGNGVGYMGTINGIHVFATNMDAGKGLLFSGGALRRVALGTVHGNGVIDFEFYDDENPSACKVRLKTAVVTEWDDTPVFDLRQPMKKAQPQPNGKRRQARLRKIAR